MNFFERQEQAQRKSGYLVLLYLLAVVLTILAVHSLVVFLFASVESQQSAGASILTSSLLPAGYPPYWRAWFLPNLLLTDSLILLAVIGGASLIKIVQLKDGGGDGVAVSLGGTLVKPSTTNLQEKRLLNVVEEMAIASGIRVPNVYILKGESGINAFAAGFSPATSVVAVTQGALDYLNRDELQGVIGHEFSHILHQDTNLNLKLIGVLFGLEMLVILGMVLFRNSIYFASISDGGDRDSKGAGAAIALAMVLFGLGLMVVGLIGQLFSNIIRAAISRQREFLADASSVQYTRNPSGIADALKKIGCPRVGSRVKNSRSVEAAHMFFGNVFSGGFLSHLFDSHPDLGERIQRLDPSFDGNFPSALYRLDPMTLLPIRPDQTPEAGEIPGAGLAGRPLGKSASFTVQSPGGPASAATPALFAAAILDSVGRPEEKKLKIAESLLAAIPESLAESVRDPLGAQAAVCAMLLGTDPNDRRPERAVFDSTASVALKAKTAEQFALWSDTPESLKIPVAELAFPTLKTLDKREYIEFRKLVAALIQADAKVDIFEFSLFGALIRDLDRAFGLVKVKPPKYTKMDSLLEPFYTVMSFLAYAGSDDPEERRKAFEAGCAFFYLDAEIRPQEQCTAKAFADALATLTEATFVLRHKLLTAFYCCIAADGVVTEREGELIRAVAAHFDCPMPTWQEWADQKSAAAPPPTQPSGPSAPPTD